jgi:hypothetical protein
MTTWRLGLAWAFILGVAAYDTYFAWQYRAVFDAWEINPLARTVVSRFGLGALFGLKATAVAFAAVVAALCYRCRRRVTACVYTACVGGAHLALCVQYLVGHLWR